MPALARLAAVLAAALAPLAALAQQGGVAPRAGYGWLWIVVAAIVVVALYRLLVGPGRRNRPHPPARPPGV
jgi:hypothetical protein